MIEQDPDITLQKVKEDCQRLINLKETTHRSKKKNISRVQTIKQLKFTKGIERKRLSVMPVRGYHLQKNFKKFKTKVNVLSKSEIEKWRNEKISECKNKRTYSEVIVKYWKWHFYYEWTNMEKKGLSTIAWYQK